MKQKKFFTLAEIIIVIVVVGILGTIAIPVFTNAIEGAKAKACELNLKTILAALEVYIRETDSFPASLSQIKQEQIQTAREKVLKKEGRFKTDVIYFLAGLGNHGSAQAQNWIGKYVESRYLVCPAAGHGRNSYGINSTLQGISYSQYQQLPVDVDMVADSDTPSITPGSAVTRHKRFNGLVVEHYGLRVDKEKKIKRNQ